LEDSRFGFGSTGKGTIGTFYGATNINASVTGVTVTWMKNINGNVFYAYTNNGLYVANLNQTGVPSWTQVTNTSGTSEMTLDYGDTTTGYYALVKTGTSFSILTISGSTGTAYNFASGFVPDVAHAQPLYLRELKIFVLYAKLTGASYNLFASDVVQGPYIYVSSIQGFGSNDYPSSGSTISIQYAEGKIILQQLTNATTTNGKMFSCALAQVLQYGTFTTIGGIDIELAGGDMQYTSVATTTINVPESIHTQYVYSLTYPANNNTAFNFGSASSIMGVITDGSYTADGSQLKNISRSCVSGTFFGASSSGMMDGAKVDALWKPTGRLYKYLFNLLALNLSALNASGKKLQVVLHLVGLDITGLRYVGGYLNLSITNGPITSTGPTSCTATGRALSVLLNELILTCSSIKNLGTTLKSDFSLLKSSCLQTNGTETLSDSYLNDASISLDITGGGVAADISVAAKWTQMKTSYYHTMFRLNEIHQYTITNSPDYNLATRDASTELSDLVTAYNQAYTAMTDYVTQVTANNSALKYTL